MQRVHSISRLKEYGRSVHMLGRKSMLYIGSIPSSEATNICKLVEPLFDIPCKALKNYLAVTLTPSNPILHSTRIYSMFKDWKPGVVYPRNFLFYEDWDDASSDMLICCDSEEQSLCGVLPICLDEVVSLRTYYESQDAKAMTKKIRGIKAFKGLTSPMKKTDNGWIPNFESRYFMEELLRLEHLNVEYKVRDGYLSAVNDVSLFLNRGEVLAIVGESGCGKSTIAHGVRH